MIDDIYTLCHVFVLEASALKHPALKGRGERPRTNCEAGCNCQWRFYSATVFIVIAVVVFVATLFTKLHMFVMICSNSFPQVLLFLLYSFAEREVFRNTDIVELPIL